MTGPRIVRSTLIAADEARFMDLWDAGHSREQIIELTAAPPERVDYVLGYMRDTITDLQTAPLHVRRASASLLAALRLHHPDRCAEGSLNGL